MGDPSTLTRRDRNLLWRHFTGQTAERFPERISEPISERRHMRVVREPEEIAAFEASAVGDCAPRQPATQTMTGCGHSSKTCARTAFASVSCGTRASSGHTSPTSRSSTTQKSDASHSTAMSSPSRARICE